MAERWDIYTVGLKYSELLDGGKWNSSEMRNCEYNLIKQTRKQGEAVMSNKSLINA